MEPLGSLNSTQIPRQLRPAAVAEGVRVRLAFIIGVALFAVVAVPRADAAPGWLGAAGVSDEGQTAAGLQIAFDRQGDALVAWERREGAENSVQAAFRSLRFTIMP